MFKKLILCLIIIIEGGLCASEPCDGEVTYNSTGDVESCYECGKSKLTSSSELWLKGPKLAASQGDFPWHATIYYKKGVDWKQFCGGTLISSQAVLTSATCVTRRYNIYHVKPVNSEYLQVALGKTYRSWNAIESSGVKRKVKEIRVHEHYKGIMLHFANDIALLLLDSPVPFSNAVMPACVDYSRNQPSLYYKDAIGYVAGMGYTEECGARCSNQSERLMYTSTRVLSFDECFHNIQTILPFSFSSLTPDKVCIGNGSVSPVQQGDGGEALTILSRGLHYVTGVANRKIKSKSGIKGIYSFGGFTNLSHHMEWLHNNLP